MPNMEIPPGYGLQSHSLLRVVASNLPVGVNVSVHGCLCLCVSLACHELAEVLPRLSPDVSWDRLQPPATLISGSR